MKEYDAMDLLGSLGNKPWLCPTPNIGLSMSLRDHDYDGFIKTFISELRVYGVKDLEHLELKCEGQCPKGCDKKFKLKLGKSITKKSFEKMYQHGIKYPQHCMTTKFDGVNWSPIKNGH